MNRYRFCISGSRHWTDAETIRRTLTTLLEQLLGAQTVERPEQVTLVHGNARGADTLAALAAQELGMTVEAHPADWKRYGRSAGMRRNRQMLDSGVHQLLAFPLPQSVGTRGAITDARKRGIPVTIIEAQS